MWWILTAALALAAEPGWTPLFNGKDLSGWRHVGGGRFRVQDGLLRGEGGMGLLYWTGGPIGDAKVKIVFRTQGPHDNSGVYIRIPIEPREEQMPIHYGYEVQIDAHPERFKAGSFHYTGTLYSFTKPKAKPAKPGPEWNVMEITMDGPRTLVHVNGVLVTDYREGDPVEVATYVGAPQRGRRPDKGFIGVQNLDDQNIVFFKEISTQPLRR